MALKFLKITIFWASPYFNRNVKIIKHRPVIANSYFDRLKDLTVLKSVVRKLLEKCIPSSIWHLLITIMKLFIK
jgi:hypothetical protein